MDNEIWKPVTGYEGYYEVSNLGRIRRLQTRDRFGRQSRPHIVKQYKNSRWGYMQVTLHQQGSNKTYRVHCLVAIAFLGDRPVRLDINHVDGDKTNNRFDNLEYCTRSQNIIHALDHGLSRKRGEDHHSAKLTADQISAIRTASESGQSGKSLAEQYGVGRSQISRIVNRKRWNY